MKMRMCWEIAKNLGRLFSLDFWKLALFDKEFPAKSIVLMTIFASCADIIRMIIVPGYPGSKA